VLDKIRKDAVICYNGAGKKGNCAGNYGNGNKVCAYCLEYLCKRPNPDKKMKPDIDLNELLNKSDKDTSNSGIEIPKVKEWFRFPIDLIEFPLVNGRNPKEFLYEGKVYIIQDLTSVIGKGKYHYITRTPRPYTLMDFRTLLATLYFADDYKSRFIENKFTEWLDLIEVSKKGKYYWDKIIQGIDYLKHTTFYTHYLWDTKKKTRNAYNDKDLTPTSVFSPINEYHYFKDIKRKYKLKVEVGKTFYDRIDKDKYFTYVNIKNLLPLSNIAMKLLIWVNRHKEDDLFKYPFIFELFKFNIGITDIHKTHARETFERAWKDIKDQNLLEGYNYKIWTSKKDNTEYIKFKFKEVLKP